MIVSDQSRYIAEGIQLQYWLFLKVLPFLRSGSLCVAFLVSGGTVPGNAASWRDVVRGHRVTQVEQCVRILNRLLRIQLGCHA
jgi:hypothetical protein